MWIKILSIYTLAQIYGPLETIVEIACPMRYVPSRLVTSVLVESELLGGLWMRVILHDHEEF